MNNMTLISIGIGKYASTYMLKTNPAKRSRARSA